MERKWKIKEKSYLTDLLLAHIIIVMFSIINAITTDDKMVWIFASAIWVINVILDITKLIELNKER